MLLKIQEYNGSAGRFRGPTIEIAAWDLLFSAPDRGDGAYQGVKRTLGECGASNLILLHYRTTKTYQIFRIALPSGIAF